MTEASKVGFRARNVSVSMSGSHLAFPTLGAVAFGAGWFSVVGVLHGILGGDPLDVRSTPEPR